MPLRAFCHKCGAVLYEGETLKAPYEIVSGYDGRCPECRRKLSFMPKKVEIRHIDEPNSLSRVDKKKRGRK